MTIFANVLPYLAYRTGILFNGTTIVRSHTLKENSLKRQKGNGYYSQKKGVECRERRQTYNEGIYKMRVR